MWVPVRIRDKSTRYSSPAGPAIVPRILFVKTSSLGDVVHHCPAVSDVAHVHPGAMIDWVVEETFAPVAAMHPAVRRVIPVALRRWRGAPWKPAAWSELAAFRRALRAEAYDAVIDTQGLLKSALIARAARGPRHGYDAASVREAVAARFYQHYHAVDPRQHAVARNRALSAAALGFGVPEGCDYGLRAPVAPSPQTVPGVPGAYAVLLTMTSRADKLWPEDRWVEVMRALAARGLQPVLPWGDADERERCRRLAGAIAPAGARVPDRLPLPAVASLLAAARLVVGVDTGLAHLAVALGRPTLGLYCSTDPARTGLYAGAQGRADVRNLGGAGRPPAVAEVLAAIGALADTGAGAS